MCTRACVCVSAWKFARWLVLHSVPANCLGWLVINQCVFVRSPRSPRGSVNKSSRPRHTYQRLARVTATIKAAIRDKPCSSTVPHTHTHTRVERGAPVCGCMCMYADPLRLKAKRWLLRSRVLMCFVSTAHAYVSEKPCFRDVPVVHPLLHSAGVSAGCHLHCSLQKKWKTLIACSCPAPSDLWFLCRVYRSFSRAASRSPKLLKPRISSPAAQQTKQIHLSRSDAPLLAFKEAMPSFAQYFFC